MTLKLQRFLDRVVGTPLCALISFISYLFGKPASEGPPRRILIIILSEMGSLILARPMFARLKLQYPDAAIHVLLFAKNREVLELLDVVPAANVLTLNNESLPRFFVDFIRAITQLRALKLDAVIDCELFSRVSSILAYLSGARTRIGFHRYTQEGLYRGSFINRPVLYNPYRHLTLQFFTMVAALQSVTRPLGKELPVSLPKRQPPIFLSGPERELTASRLHGDFPAVAGKRLVLIYPSGGILPIRAWPLNSYKTVCSALVADGYAVAIIGLEEDQPLGRALVANCESEFCIDLTGWTRSVRELLTLFWRAALLITNDGGPAHFAALTPIASIVLFGPETPLLYRSFSDNAHPIYVQMPCSPCLTAYNHRNSPCDGDNKCLKQIAPERVLAKARQILDNGTCSPKRDEYSTTELLNERV